ncbi:hypothetical protein TNCV_1578621 [Trichonephila clavipes]|nr:hypothetical protein TNCV_1578621 [Trichonephila clavipes]
MRGLWEAGIKSVKYHLKRALGRSRLPYEEFEPVIIQAEGILNSRPLTPIPNDFDNFEIKPLEENNKGNLFDPIGFRRPRTCELHDLSNHHERIKRLYGTFAVKFDQVSPHARNLEILSQESQLFIHLFTGWTDVLPAPEIHSWTCTFPANRP